MLFEDLYDSNRISHVYFQRSSLAKLDLPQLMKLISSSPVPVQRVASPNAICWSGPWQQSVCLCVLRPPAKGSRGEQDALAERWGSRQKPEGDEGGHPGYASWDEETTAGGAEKHRRGGAPVRSRTNKLKSPRARCARPLWRSSPVISTLCRQEWRF